MQYQPEIKCATFDPALQAAIPPHIRAKMDADRAAAVAAKTSGEQFFWLAESPTIPGYYLARTPRKIGKLGEQEELGTPNAHEAYTFSTRMACEKYCRENQVPKWIPVEHCFCANTQVTDAEPSTPANTRAQGPRSV